MTGFRIQRAETREEIALVTGLFEQYAASLPVQLDYQDFAGELAALPGKYAPPRGTLLLARDADDEALGCVGVRPLGENGICEMKRLYLAPAARGRGVGRALAEAAIAAARAGGYREFRLDTLPSMTSAIALYERMGFVRIAPYYGPTPHGTVFMALRLQTP